jgi:hypothetical protein
MAIAGAVLVAVLRVRGMSMRIAVAQQDRQRRGDALQRHYCEREQQYEFSARDGHDGAAVYLTRRFIREAKWK